MAEQVGPFYDTAGVQVVLAAPGTAPVSKQAIEQRRRRRTVLALQTADHRWIYPVWQFREGQVLPGLHELLAVFEGHSAWSVATWLTTPSSELAGRTPVAWLLDGTEQDRLLRVAGQTAHRWAASGRSESPPRETPHDRVRLADLARYGDDEPWPPTAYRASRDSAPP